VIAREKTIKEKQGIDQTKGLNRSGAGGKAFPPAFLDILSYWLVGFILQKLLMELLHFGLRLL